MANPSCCGLTGVALSVKPQVLAPENGSLLIIEQFAQDSIEAVDHLANDGRVTQALILLYSAIDTFGWLGSTNAVASRQTFVQWVERYLLPDSTLPCSAAEVYTARCALLHTTTAQSSATQRGDARQLWYWTTDASRSLLEYEIGDRTDVVLVRVSDLVGAFSAAVNRFIASISSDSEARANAQGKARLWLAWVPAPPAA